MQNLGTPIPNSTGVRVPSRAKNDIWRNCTNEELFEVLADCPEVVEELKKIGYNDLVNSYDALLPRYNMDRVTAPVHKDNSDEIECFSYWYRIDSQEHNADIAFKTKAEAQLASIKETKQELRNRILAAR